MAQVDPAPVTVALGVSKNPSISTPPWLSSRPPLATVRVPGAKMPTPVKPATVADEPSPETTMLLDTRRSRPVCSVPPFTTESVPPLTNTPCARPATSSRPPSMVRPPPKQLHSVRSPPIVPMLPPLLAPVRVRVVEVLESSTEPAPENEPEKVVLVLGVMVRNAATLVGPMTTVPPPDDPLASVPMATSALSPMVSVAPVLTAKVGWGPEFVVTALLIVKVAPLVTLKE